MRTWLSSLAALVLAACAPGVPESGSGVGFGDYDSYQAQIGRDAALTTSQRQTLPAPGGPVASVSAAPSGEVPVATGAPTAAEIDRALGRSPAAVPPVITPDASGPTVSGQNLAGYAASTTNQPGERIYSRGVTSQREYERACGSWSTAALAQQAFMAAGGPERDRMGMDPDGDGFACGWDPRPLRAAQG